MNTNTKRIPWNKGKKETEKHRYINNGVINRRIPVTAPIPSGFIAGRIPRHLSEESKQSFINRSRETKLNRYGSETFNNTKKAQQTKQARYNDKNYNNRNKAKQTCLERYTVENVAQLASVKALISKSSIMHRHSDITKLKLSMLKTGKQMLKEVKEQKAKKEYATKKANNSFNSSKPEELFFSQLLCKYQPSDIIRTYRDSRYPFNCDFYIKSEDKFIELHLHWTHGGRPYDPTDEDCQKQLEVWKEKAKVSKYYKIAIETWTVRDVLKLKAFKDNNLNYSILYKI